MVIQIHNEGVAPQNPLVNYVHIRVNHKKMIVNTPVQKSNYGVIGKETNKLSEINMEVV